jgi:uncharacterized membrane protein
MSSYFILKWLHILSATVLFGTGMGIAFFKWITDRTGDVRAIRITNERTVLADWLFTTPAVILQPATGLGLIYLVGYPLSSSWVMWSVLLYVVAGACWLPVVKLQMVMRDISRKSDKENALLPPRYWQLARYWFWLGIPAFSALVMVFWLMITKPA